MTEERSRFEKWWTAELLSGKTWTSADIENMELAWRAALEDRQEAAPETWRDGFIAGQEHMKFRVSQLSSPTFDKYDTPRSAHDKYALAILNLPIETQLPGVPSEATPSKEDFAAKFEECNRDRTQLFDEFRRRGGEIQELTEKLEALAAPEVPIAPSKENAPLPVPTYFVTHPYGSYSIADPAAPAPEVQGPPTSISAESSSPLQLAAESAAPVGTPQRCQFLKSEHRICGGLREHHGDSSHEFVPVGTPQKETPPVFIKRYTTEEARAAGLPVADGAVEILLYGSSVGAVPEGVQGKEPQTYDEWLETVPRCIGGENGCDGDLVAEAHEANCPLSRIPDSEGRSFGAGLRQAFSAGRRSAITELQARLEKECLESTGLYGEGLETVIAWCAELQEKTK